MKGKQLATGLLVAAIVLILGGVLLGATDVQSGGISCGTAFAPNDDAAGIYDATFADHSLSSDFGANCDDARQQRLIFALFAIGLGAVVGLGAAVVYGTSAAEVKDEGLTPSP